MKPLVSPLLLLLLVTAGVLAVYRWKLRRNRWKVERFFWWIAVLVFVAVGFLSTPFGTRALETVVASDDFEGEEPPTHIVVLSGGYVASAGEAENDVLSRETALRVAVGVAWANEHPDASVVMTGGGDRPDRDPVRMAELMRDYAVARGLEEDRVFLETQARNTRGHPLSLLEKDLVDTEARVGIVTSSWHLRRARREFERHFDSLQWRGARAVDFLPHRYQWLLPDAEFLNQSTTYLRELLGLFWYETTADTD